MTTLCIIRHGETDWNTEGRFQGIEDIKLNEAGKKQALDCAKYLNIGKWNAIITSPLIRAKETADIISKAIGIEKVEVMNELIERDLGSASGLLPKERNERFPDNKIPDAEPREAIKERVTKALNDIDSKYKDQNVIVITHGGVINSIMLKLTDNEFDINQLKIKNGSITILKGHKYDWDIELFNYICEK